MGGSPFGGGGGKGGGGSSRGAQQSSDQLSAILTQLFAETDPVRQELGKQFLSALQTGGVGAQIPLITAAQSQSRQATSRALADVDAYNARSGLTRTPYGASLRGQTALAGEQRTSMIPSEITAGFLAGAPSFAMAPTNAIVSGFGQLSGQATSQNIAKGQQQTGILNSLLGVGGNIGSGIGLSSLFAGGGGGAAATAAEVAPLLAL